MKTISVAGFIALASWTAQAALPSDDAVVGQMLDATGVTMKSFQPNSLPLPAGNWKIVGRTEVQLNLTGNGPSTVPEITLTLENQDKSSPLMAALVTYTPEQVGIRWNGNEPCDKMGAKAAWVNDHGKTPGTLTYACTNNYVNIAPKTLKAYLLGLPENKNQWYKARMTPLVPSADNLDFSYNWMWATFNKDKGRRMTVVFMSKLPADYKAGDATETRLKEWAAQMGDTYIDWIEGGKKTLAAFPAMDAK